MARLIERLAEDPRVFTWLRKVAEANFTAVRRAAAAELPLEQPARVLDLGLSLIHISRCRRVPNGVDLG
ncbi:MAG: hypothetical protein QUU85_10280, partial [Candidatus Eisenbacteria bacterium]|nr:hypothetical protein [Candidatus Eisenbacteria bacterium]